MIKRHTWKTATPLILGYKGKRRTSEISNVNKWFEKLGALYYKTTASMLQYIFQLLNIYTEAYIVHIYHLPLRQLFLSCQMHAATHVSSRKLRHVHVPISTLTDCWGQSVVSTICEFLSTLQKGKDILCLHPPTLRRRGRLFYVPRAPFRRDRIAHHQDLIMNILTQFFCPVKSQVPYICETLLSNPENSHCLWREWLAKLIIPRKKKSD